MVSGDEVEFSTEQLWARQQLMLWSASSACVRGRNIALFDKREE